MSRLWRLIAILIVILFIAVFVAERLGERQPPPPVTTLLTNPDGSPCERPCLLGMKPGVTRFEEAYAFVRNHPLSRASSLQESLSNETLFEFYAPSIQVMIAKGSDGTLSQCNLTLQGLTLGEMINLLGLPAGVNAGVSTAYLYYPSDGLVLFIVNPNRLKTFTLDAFEPVDAIVLYPALHPIFVKLPEFAKPWQGFANAARYGD